MKIILLAVFALPLSMPAWSQNISATTADQKIEKSNLTLSSELVLALNRASLFTEDGKECAIFAYHPDEASKPIDFEIIFYNRHSFNHSLRRSFSNNSLRRVLLWSKERPLENSLSYYIFSNEPTDYQKDRQYEKNDVDASYAITTKMVGPGPFPRITTTLPSNFDQPYYIDTASQWEAIVHFMPYFSVNDRILQETAQKDCDKPLSERINCGCAATYD